jgi:hypothetical protein
MVVPIRDPTVCTTTTSNAPATSALLLHSAAAFALRYAVMVWRFTALQRGPCYHIMTCICCNLYHIRIII